MTPYLISEAVQVFASRIDLSGRLQNADLPHTEYVNALTAIDLVGSCRHLYSNASVSLEGALAIDTERLSDSSVLVTSTSELGLAEIFGAAIVAACCPFSTTEHGAQGYVVEARLTVISDLFYDRDHRKLFLENVKYGLAKWRYEEVSQFLDRGVVPEEEYCEHLFDFRPFLRYADQLTARF